MTCEQAGPKQLAQEVATIQLLSDGQFPLGAGENRNEHMAGGQWPHIGRFGDMRRSKRTPPPGHVPGGGRRLTAVLASGPTPALTRRARPTPPLGA
jgi:hypothetical protein